MTTNNTEIYYNNDSIYQLLNNVNDGVYVGPTCQSLSNIFYEHRHNNTHFNITNTFFTI